MEPTVPTPAPSVAPSNGPVVAHTTLQPLPKHSVLIAVLVAATIPAVLLVITLVVMSSLNLNILNWME